LLRRIRSSRTEVAGLFSWSMSGKASEEVVDAFVGAGADFTASASRAGVVDAVDRAGALRVADVAGRGGVCRGRRRK
jgi:hypothetical protein